MRSLRTLVDLIGRGKMDFYTTVAVINCRENAFNLQKSEIHIVKKVKKRENVR